MISSKPSRPGRPLKIAFLFTKVRTGASISRNHFYGMYELRDRGFETDYLELERFLPKGACKFLRRFLNMHFAHLPLFPLFFKYDIVFSSTGYASLVLKNLLHIRSFKWVMLDFNILGTIGDRATLKQKLFAWAVSRADAVVAISESEKRGLEEAFPRLRGKVAFIHEATDMDLFKPGSIQVPTGIELSKGRSLSERAETVRAEGARPSPRRPEGEVRFREASSAGLEKVAVPGGTLAAADPYILSVGTYGRDFDTLVKAVAGSGVRTVIATKPERVAHLLPLPENVTARFFPSGEMPALYAGASAVVISLAPQGAYDSVGTLSLGEAFAMARATIVSETDSMKSYVEDGRNALFVPLGDAAAMRTAIERLLSDAGLRDRLGAEARRYAEENLTLDRFADRLGDLFRKLLLI